jgi:hypothetical protein
LFLYSTAWEINNTQPFASSIRLQLQKYHPYSVYTPPDYAKQVSKSRPDFRQLLYWNPDIIISQNQSQLLEFYTSDHSGNFTIRIEGITSDGNPISITAKIKVK